VKQSASLSPSCVKSRPATKLFQPRIYPPLSIPVPRRSGPFRCVWSRPCLLLAFSDTHRSLVMPFVCGCSARSRYRKTSRRAREFFSECGSLNQLLPQSSKMGTVTKGFDARLANRPFLVFDFRALWRSTLHERQSARKSKTKNGRLASLASNH